MPLFSLPSLSPSSPFSLNLTLLYISIVAGVVGWLSPSSSPRGHQDHLIAIAVAAADVVVSLLHELLHQKTSSSSRKLRQLTNSRRRGDRR
ncbi:hypothetical protein TIFTF001_014795 [Ficus carica]|uniref:Transmembrane protein n=1 Tax=Ficus carica TaxID=3494 RepID=A0AA88ARU0_FICCA|nr:hypothetical protein TIFTF001_014795 [Ficus carica]